MQPNFSSPPQTAAMYESKPPKLPMNGRQKTVKITLVSLALVSLAIWIAALWMPAYIVTGRPDLIFYGSTAFLFGLFSADGVAAWLANLPFFVAIIISLFYRRTTMLIKVLILSSLAFVLSMLCLAVTQLPVTSLGGKHHPVELSYAGYFWMGSILIMLISSVIAFVLRDKTTT